MHKYNLPSGHHPSQPPRLGMAPNHSVGHPMSNMGHQMHMPRPPLMRAGPPMLQGGPMAAQRMMAVSTAAGGGAQMATAVRGASPGKV